MAIVLIHFISAYAHILMNTNDVGLYYAYTIDIIAKADVQKQSNDRKIKTAMTLITPGLLCFSLAGKGVNIIS